MSGYPITENEFSSIVSGAGIPDISKATIRQCVAVGNEIQKIAGEPIVHLEMGVPGIPLSKIGTQAQKEAIDRGIPAVYPPIQGYPDLKENASKFIKAFVGVDISPKCIIPTVGSMQGSYNLALECSQLYPHKDSVLYICPGFPAHGRQPDVLGIRNQTIDLYDFRGKALLDEVERHFKSGRTSAMLYSNPNNPTWACLTEEELKGIGELATKYDVILLEDLAYFCMDFRTDLSRPFEPPYQPTVARYTDNYVMMISGSKMFSYAGERIAVVAISDKLYDREYETLRERYGISSFGDNFVLTYLYVASSGTSHSAQYAMSAMMKAAVEGKYDFVGEAREDGVRAGRAKEVSERHGFNIVYDKDLDKDLANGFYFTAEYGDMDNRELLTRLLRCGVNAITLNTTASAHRGIRVCVSQLSKEESFRQLDERLGLFENIDK